MKTKLISLILIALFILSGCGSAEKPPFPEKAPDEISFPDSNNIDIDVYIDSTVSMAGFAAEDVTSSYVCMIPGISNVSSTLSGTLGKVQYFSFGEKIVGIDQTQFSNSRKQSFYTENSDINKKTDMTTVVKALCDKFNTASKQTDKPARLSVIISDLFEDNSNIDPLITCLKKSFGDSELSIGFLGIRSYFNGKVFDIGRSTEGRPYASDVKKASTYRPFYIMILGKPGDVQKYYKELDKVFLGTLPADTKYFEFFSKHGLLKQGTFANPPEIIPQEDSRAKIKIDGNFNNETDDPRIQPLKVYIGGVGDNEKTDEVLSAELDIHSVSNTRLAAAIASGKNIYKDKADSLLSIDTKVEMSVDGAFQDISSSANCIKSSKVRLDNGKISTELTVNPYGLKAGYYRLEVTVGYDADLLTPIIPADWNMKDENDPLFGTKTINLYNLLEGFYGLSKGFTEPLAHAYYYLKIVS